MSSAVLSRSTGLTSRRALWRCQAAIQVEFILDRSVAARDECDLRSTRPARRADTPRLLTRAGLAVVGLAAADDLVRSRSTREREPGGDSTTLSTATRGVRAARTRHRSQGHRARWSDCSSRSMPARR